MCIIYTYYNASMNHVSCRSELYCCISSTDSNIKRQVPSYNPSAVSCAPFMPARCTTFIHFVSDNCPARCTTFIQFVSHNCRYAQCKAGPYTLPDRRPRQDNMGQGSEVSQ